MNSSFYFNCFSFFGSSLGLRMPCFHSGFVGSWMTDETKIGTTMSSTDGDGRWAVCEWCTWSPAPVDLEDFVWITLGIFSRCLQKTAAGCPDLSSTASVCYCLVYHEFCTRFEIFPFKLNEDSHGTLRVMLNFLIYVCLHWVVAAEEWEVVYSVYGFAVNLKYLTTLLCIVAVNLLISIPLVGESIS